MKTRFEIINGKCVIPYGVTEIDACEFFDCLELREIVFPDSLEVIGNQAFGYCNNLKGIRIPKSVQSINSSAFRSCSQLDRIEVDEENPYYKSVSNTLLTRDGKTLLFGCRSSEIPDGVECIRPLAFWRLGLKSAHIPDSVTTIGHWAFAECMNLKSISIPAGVKEIDIAALYFPLSNLFLSSVNPEECVDLSEALLGKRLGRIRLHVPAGSEDAYRQHSFFKEFKDVVA